MFCLMFIFRILLFDRDHAYVTGVCNSKYVIIKAVILNHILVPSILFKFLIRGSNKGRICNVIQ